MKEVEVRGFISEDEYRSLIRLLEEEGVKIKEDRQITIYFSCDEDLRIQKNKDFAKIWLKKGKIHDDSREEIEIKFERNRFEELKNLFMALGYDVEIKWYRKRHLFRWKDLKISVDHTVGYGHIVEVEELCQENEEDRAKERVRRVLGELDVDETPREKFDEKFRHYRKRWKSILREKDFSDFEDL